MDFWTQINQKDEVRQVIARHYNQFRETAIKVIDEGKAKGVFKDVDPNRYASYMIAVIDGLSLQSLFDDQAFDYESMVKKAGRLLLEGIKK